MSRCKLTSRRLARPGLPCAGSHHSHSLSHTLHHSHLLTTSSLGVLFSALLWPVCNILLFFGSMKHWIYSDQSATSEILIVRWSRSMLEPSHGNLATAHIYQYTIVIFQYKQKYYFWSTSHFKFWKLASYCLRIYFTYSCLTLRVTAVILSSIPMYFCHVCLWVCLFVCMCECVYPNNTIYTVLKFAVLTQSCVYHV